MPRVYALPVVKKYLDYNGLTYLAQKLNNYPTNDVIEAVIDGIQDELDEKVNLSSVGVAGGVASLGDDGKVPLTQIPPVLSYEVDGTYDAQTNKLATVQTVRGAIGQLSGGTISTPATSKTVTAISQTNGNISVSFGDIAITKSQVSDFPQLGDAALKNSVSLIDSSTESTTLPTVGAIRTILETKMDSSVKGRAYGVAELDANGKVPSSQLPSYVDNVVEYADVSSFPATGESGKIYVDLSEKKTYRWSGTEYTVIGTSLALGTSASTAFRGDYGNIAYQHASAKGSAYSSGLYKITTNSEGHITSATAVVKADITLLGIPGSDTTYEFDSNYNASSNKAATVKTVTDAVAGKKNLQSAIDDPSAEQNATSISFISNITQNTQGVISPTKKVVRPASSVQSGLMSAADKLKLDGIAGINIFYVAGGLNDTDGVWTGQIENLEDYYDGLTIIYVPSANGGSAGTTLNINSFGAKTCYCNNTTALTTRYTPGTPILFTYRDNAWRRADYNTNTTYAAQTAELLIAGTDTTNRTIRSDVFKAALKGAVTRGGNGHLYVYDSDLIVYTLPPASASSLGGVRIGTNLSIDSDGVMSAVDTKYSAITTAQIDALFA